MALNLFDKRALAVPAREQSARHRQGAGERRRSRHPRPGRCGEARGQGGARATRRWRRSRRTGRCRSRSASTGSARRSTMPTSPRWRGPIAIWSCCRRCGRSRKCAASKIGMPLAVMIETAAAVLDAPAIAHHCDALIAGTNDLAADLRLPRVDRAAAGLCAAVDRARGARRRDRGVRRRLSTRSTMRRALPPRRRRAACWGSTASR